MSKKPRCIIVTGRPGAGKTTLAKKLGEQLAMPLVSRDEIKEGYVNTYCLSHDELPGDTNALVSNSFFEIVNFYLARNISIVIEAAFQHRVWATCLPHIQHLASPLIVLCCLEAEIAANRHLQRGLENEDREFYHGDSRVSNYKNTGEVLPPDAYTEPQFDVPTIRVSTKKDYVPSLEHIIEQIRVSNPSRAAHTKAP